MSERSEARIDLPIAGMTCAACSARLERVIGRVPGVREVRVNYATGVGSVRVDPVVAGPDALAAAVRRAGYQIAADHEEGVGVRAPSDAGHEGWRVALASTLAAPVVVVGMSHGRILPGTSGLVLQAVLTAIVVGVAGAPILRAAREALRAGTADMNVLVAMGIAAAWAGSALGVARAGAHAGEHGAAVYFEAAASTTALVLLGRWLEGRARGRATDALTRLLHRAPASARVRTDQGEEVRAVRDVALGDVVVVRSGEASPVDGWVREGVATVDRSMQTGESAPAPVAVGEALHAGERVVEGHLAVATIAVGSRTWLARVARQVAEAQAGRAPVARLADRVSAVFAPAVLAIAVLTGVLWRVLGGPEATDQAWLSAVSVLVVACPCALGLATPMALLVGSGRAAEVGVVVRDVAALEVLARADRVVFDKTGTLTAGRPAVRGVTLLGLERQDALTCAAAVEASSAHPVARAIRDAFGGVAPVAEDARTEIGRGVAGRVRGRAVAVGDVAWVRGLGLGPPSLEAAASAIAAAGGTPVAVGIDGDGAVLEVVDALRDGARGAVAALRELGVEVMLLSGDRPEVAARVGAELGLATAVGGVLPEGKAAWVERLRGEGRVVVMVGDGVNDAPALASADVGVAMGGGVDVAAEAAGLVLPADDPLAVPRAIRVSRATMRVVRRNLAWAFGYNVLALPWAAGAWIPLGGPGLTPMLASALMALSSVSVVLSSLTLSGWKEER